MSENGAFLYKTTKSVLDALEQENNQYETSTLDILKPTNAVKVIAQTARTAIVGGYGVVFGGKDLEGETFTKDTDYVMDLVPIKFVFYDHAQQKNVSHKIGMVSNADITIDDTGLWIKAELDKSAAYVDGVLKLIDEGVLGWSSGTVAHLARRDNGLIKSWPLVEFSLTATPAEPRTLGVERIKQLAETYPSLKALLPEDTQESVSDSAGAGNVETDIIGKTKTRTGEIMTENVEKQAPEQVDNGPVLDAIGKLAEGLKAFDTRLQAIEEKPANPIDAAKTVNVVMDTEHWRYDNHDAGDLSLVISVLEEAKRNGRSRHGARVEAYKALAHRLESAEAGKEEYTAAARKAMKIAGVKTNELNQSTLANYGDEWAGVAYSGQLWQSIRHESYVLPKLPSLEVPAGAESIVIPLESTDPSWYKVAQSASLTSNPGGIVSNTVTASTLGTDNVTLTLGKMGARTLWTGEMEEDSVLPFVSQLRQQLVTSGAEYLEHVLIDGDTDTTASTNINDIAGTPAGTEAFLILNGFRKSPLITTTANSRDGGALTVEDYLETVKLMGLAGGNAADQRRVGFIIDPYVHWKSLELAEIKSQDVFFRPTIENGKLLNIWGYDVHASYLMHKANRDATYGYKSNANGKLDLDTASNNTKGVILAVRWDQWQFGWRRRMTLETTRVPAADATEIVALMRFGMIQRDTEASAISYNLTI